MKISVVWRLCLSLLLIVIPEKGFSQSWMSNFSYRKLITFDKNKVVPTVSQQNGVRTYQDLQDFTLLIDLQDEDLIHNPGACGNKISDPLGRDIAFALSTAAGVPLNFQLEHYDPVRGHLRCWLKVPLLSAQMSPSPATAVYIYYGSTTLQDQQSPNAQQCWTADNIGVWHMNPDGVNPSIPNVKNFLAAQRITTSTGMSSINYQNSPLGRAISLNGLSESLQLKIPATTSFSLSAWINCRNFGTEQMIATNDSTLSNGSSEGFTCKLNANGNLVVELRKFGIGLFSHTSGTALKPGTWHYICITTTGYDIAISLDGAQFVGRAGTVLRTGLTGIWKIGTSKQGNLFFNGQIDEFRMRQGSKSIEYYQTEFANQKNPRAFYNISAEEFASGTFKKFNGTVNDQWDNPANWQNASTATEHENVLVAAGKTLKVQQIDLSLNKLVLEAGATLSVTGKLHLKCKMEIAKQARILLGNDANLSLEADVRNHGVITGNQSSQFIFKGKNVQHYYGEGSADLYSLKTALQQRNDTLLLDAPIVLNGNLSLEKGLVNSNGMLTLSDRLGIAATVLPIADLSQVNILGNVKVEQYISGNFTSPATSRGWRLLSSPVYHNSGYYNISSYQSAMFITGPGGQSKGFDPSPLNGGTIYRHNQSLPGTLSQKYYTLPDASTLIPFGQGIYVFSRGSRWLSNAYQTQVQSAPFINPGPYTIVHTGKLYLGEFSVDLFNQDQKKDGDGFNLLGNPYAASIVWSKLGKSNLTDFIWQFDVLNNSYKVSDLPETIIPSGTGFFVRVKTGNSSGKLTFSESSKTDITTGKAKSSSVPVNTLATNIPYEAVQKRVIIKLSKGDFREELILKLKLGGNDAIDDEDAIKIGEGFVEIASICDGKKLAVEEKSWADSTITKIYIRGWAKGVYKMAITEPKQTEGHQLQLTDHYTSQTVNAVKGKLDYEFTIDPEIAASYGETRFSLVLKQAKVTRFDDQNDMMIYPNPFSTQLHIGMKQPKALRILVRNLYGQLIHDRTISPGENLLSGVHKLPMGIYLIQVCDKITGRMMKTFKAVRN